MTTDIERQFFETFGIEKRQVDCEQISRLGCENKDCKTCKYSVYEYSQISDRILLGLICIANKEYDYPISTNIKNIQARTLRMLLRAKKFYKDTYSYKTQHNYFVKKVQSLFKEG